MDPILQKQSGQIIELIQKLRETLEHREDDVKQQHAAKEKMLQERWEERKEVAQLQRIANDYDALREENERLKTERRELRDRLANVLKSAKALGKAHQS